jgi:hypothetical protein
MNGAISLLPLCVFLVRTGGTLSFLMYFQLQVLNRRMTEEIISFVSTQFIFKKSQLRVSTPSEHEIKILLGPERFRRRLDNCLLGCDTL